MQVAYDLIVVYYNGGEFFPKLINAKAEREYRVGDCCSTMDVKVLMKDTFLVYESNVSSRSLANMGYVSLHKMNDTQSLALLAIKEYDVELYKKYLLEEFKGKPIKYNHLTFNRKVLENKYG